MTRWTIPAPAGHLLTNYTSFPATYNIMTLYHKKDNDQGSPGIIPYESLLGVDLTNDSSIFINRESSWHQRNNHESKKQILQDAHEAFGNGTSFVLHFYTETGNLRFLYEKGRKGRYFRWLRKLIQASLQQTQGKLYVFAVSLARLLQRMLRIDECDTNVQNQDSLDPLHTNCPVPIR